MFNEYPYTSFEKINLDWLLDLGNKLKADAESGAFDGERGPGVFGITTIYSENNQYYAVNPGGATAGDFIIGYGPAAGTNILYIMKVTSVTGNYVNGTSITRITGPQGPQGQQGEPGEGGLTEAMKQALLQLARKVAYIDGEGQTYYTDLYNAFYPPAGLVSISALFNQGSAVIYDTDSLDTLKQYLTVTATYSDSSTAVVPSESYTLSGTLSAGTSVVTVTYGGKSTTFNVTVTNTLNWSITYNLTNFSSSNQATSAVNGSTYVTTLSYDDTQYMFGSVTVTMGGADITTTAYGDGRVQINEVTGNIVITAIANEIVTNTVLNQQSGSGLQFFDSNGTQIGGRAYQWYGYVPQTASANCTATIKIVNNGESTIGANEKIYVGNTDQFDQSSWVRVYTDCALAYTVSSLGIAPGGSITFTATVRRGYRLVFTSFSGCDVYVTGIPTDAIVYATEYATQIYNAASTTQWYPDNGSGTATTKYYGNNRITTDAFTEDTTVTVIYESGSADSGDVNANERLFGCCQSAASGQTPIYYFVRPSTAGNASIPAYGYARYVYEVKAGYHLAIKSNAESSLASGYSVRVVKGDVR